MADQPDKTPPPKKTAGQEFAAFLLAHNGGQLHDELTAELERIVDALQNTESGKPVATLAIKLTFKKDVRKGQELTVSITDTHKTTVPVEQRPVSVFYMTKDNTLSPHHPAQRALFEAPANNGSMSNEGGKA